MTSAIAKQLATATLAEVATQTGVPSISELVKRTFSSATGQPVTPGEKVQTKKDLSDIKNKIESIDKKIQQLSSEISDQLLNIKIDILHNQTSAIDSLYQEYITALTVLTDPVAERRPGERRATLTRLGIEIAAHVYTYLNGIHTYLVGEVGGEALIAKAASVTRTRSKDIVTFFVLMKSFLFNYTRVQTQGIFLMTVAHEDLTVESFSNAQPLIDKVYANLIKQQEKLVACVRPITYDLVCRFIAAPNRVVDTTISCYRGPLHIHGTTSGTGPAFTEWAIECQQDLSKIDSNADYWFKFKQTRTGDYLGLHDGDRDHIHTTGLAARDCGEQVWRISAAAEGDQFRLQYKPLTSDADSRRHMWFACYNGGYGLKQTVGTDDKDSLFNIKNLQDWGVGDWMNAYTEGNTLYPGQFLQSQNNRYRLMLNPNSGALQIMDREKNFQVIWMTDKPSINNPMSAGRFIMQTDGNLVAYNKDGKPYWATHHWSNWGNYMMLTDAGKMELKDEKRVTRVIFP